MAATANRSPSLRQEADANGKKQTVSIERWLAAKVRQQMESQCRSLPHSPAGFQQSPQELFPVRSAAASLATSGEKACGSNAGTACRRVRAELLEGRSDCRRDREHSEEEGDSNRERGRQHASSGTSDTVTEGAENCSAEKENFSIPLLTPERVSGNSRPCGSTSTPKLLSSQPELTPGLSPDQGPSGDPRLPRKRGHLAEADLRLGQCRVEESRRRRRIYSERRERFGISRERDREACTPELRSASPSGTPRPAVTLAAREERRNGSDADRGATLERRTLRSTELLKKEADEEVFDFTDSNALGRGSHREQKWCGKEDGDIRTDDDDPRFLPGSSPREWHSSGRRVSTKTHADSPGETMMHMRQTRDDSSSRSEERDNRTVHASARLRSTGSDSSRSPTRRCRRHGKDKDRSIDGRSYGSPERNRMCRDQRRVYDTGGRSHTPRKASRSRETSSPRERREDRTVYSTEVSLFRHKKSGRLAEPSRRGRSHHADRFADGDFHGSEELPSIRHEPASKARRRRRSSPREEVFGTQDYANRPRRPGCKCRSGESVGWGRKRGSRADQSYLEDGERKELLWTSREKTLDNKRHWEPGKERRRSRSIRRQRSPPGHGFPDLMSFPGERHHYSRSQTTASRSEGQSPTADPPSFRDGWRPFMEANKHRHFALKRAPDRTRALDRTNQENQSGENAELVSAEMGSPLESAGSQWSPEGMLGDGKTTVTAGHGQPGTNGPRSSDPGNLFAAFQMGSCVPLPQSGSRKQRIKVSLVTKKPEKSGTDT